MSISVPADPATVGGNLYPKYTARNPIARLLVDRFLAHLLDLARRSGARQVHEVRCGEGFLSTMLAERGFVVRGTDLAPAAIATARRRAAEPPCPQATMSPTCMIWRRTSAAPSSWCAARFWST